MNGRDSGHIETVFFCPVATLNIVYICLIEDHHLECTTTRYFYAAMEGIRAQSVPLGRTCYFTEGDKRHATFLKSLSVRHTSYSEQKNRCAEWLPFPQSIMKSDLSEMNVKKTSPVGCYVPPEIRQAVNVLVHTVKDFLVAPTPSTMSIPLIRSIFGAQ